MSWQRKQHTFRWCVQRSFIEVGRNSLYKCFRHRKDYNLGQAWGYGESEIWLGMEVQFAQSFGQNGPKTAKEQVEKGPADSECGVGQLWTRHPWIGHCRGLSLLIGPFGSWTITSQNFTFSERRCFAAPFFGAGSNQTGVTQANHKFRIRRAFLMTPGTMWDHV